MEDSMTFERIKAVIDSWDPIELLDFAPKDEYDIESSQILERYTDNIDELGKVIFDIFQKSFDDTFTNSLLECNDIAKMIVDYNHSNNK